MKRWGWLSLAVALLAAVLALTQRTPISLDAVQLGSLTAHPVQTLAAVISKAQSILQRSPAAAVNGCSCGVSSSCKYVLTT